MQTYIDSMMNERNAGQEKAETESLKRSTFERIFLFEEIKKFVSFHCGFKETAQYSKMYCWKCTEWLSRLLHVE